MSPKWCARLEKIFLVLVGLRKTNETRWLWKGMCLWLALQCGGGGRAAPGRRDFVEAAPALTGDPRIRLPPASPRRCDGKETRASHPHPELTAPRGALEETKQHAVVHSVKESHV